jgi:hypothetical protein
MTVERTKKASSVNKTLIITGALLLLGGIIWWVTFCVKEHHLQDDPMLYKLKHIMEPLHHEVKTLKLYKGDKSYTINKQKIYLCLRDEHGDYYPTNMLIYVLIHEFAHYLNKEDIGHTEKFHQIFDQLLDKAHELGIYNPSIPPLENYCMHGKEA